VTDGSILLGNGDGTFQAAQSYGAVPNPGLSLAVGDFDGDGRLDLAVAGYDFYAVGDDHGMASVYKATAMAPSRLPKTTKRATGLTPW
jgi:hypothetical protein